MAEQRKLRTPLPYEIWDAYNRGVIKAAEVDSHAVSLEYSRKLNRVDKMNELVKEIYRTVSAEAVAMGLGDDAHIVGIMLRLVKMAARFGKNTITDNARVRLGKYYPIFERHVDEWLAKYKTEVRGV